MDEAKPPPATFEIRHWWTNAVLYATEAASLREAVEKAVADGANLDGASLVGASLVGANLVGANLVGANLDRASLVGANLDRASLVGANLDRANLDRASLDRASLVGANLDRASLVGASLDGASLDGASLDGASLDGASLDWNSHAMIGEILRRAADEDIEMRKVAGLILISRDWCWEEWLSLSGDPLFPWAIETLAAWVQDGDNAPAILRRKAAEMAKPNAIPGPETT